MAVIKREQAVQQRFATAQRGNDASPNASSVPYTPEAVEQGQLPDRRKKNERRGAALMPGAQRPAGGYRRLEDRLIVSRAEEEAEFILAQAREQGYQAGLEAAQETLDGLRKAIEALQGAREEAMAQAAEDLAPMALKIAEKILQTEAKCDADLVVSLARETIASLGAAAKRIRLRVNPQEFEHVKQIITQDPQSICLDAELSAYADESVDMGSVIVETPSGNIDARFSTQLAALSQLLGISAPKI
ncbi:MAG: FliH/SctL family protein [Vampirovibrionales bacterium]|nr:FliH/SctL family protein [Vampirovibrionales bacterium]